MNNHNGSNYPGWRETRWYVFTVCLWLAFIVFVLGREVYQRRECAERTCTDMTTQPTLVYTGSCVCLEHAQ